MIFVSQAGTNQHEHICESLELFAAEALPRFAERAPKRERAKRERLAEAMEQALARRAPPREADPGTTSSGPTASPPRLVRRRPLAVRTETAPPSVAEAARELATRVGETAFASLVRGRTDGPLHRLSTGGRG